MDGIANISDSEVRQGPNLNLNLTSKTPPRDSEKDGASGEQLAQVPTGSSDSLPERRYLIRKPQALQYFHKGVLKKAQEKERVAGRFELFLDLLYVAIIANFAEKLFQDPSGDNLVIFLLTFTPAWHVWADAKENANNYYNDDMFQRIGILWLMTVLLIYGNNANYIAEEIQYLRITLGSYQVMRFTQACCFGYYSLASVFHRYQNRCYMVVVLIDMCIWIPVYLENVSNRAKIAVAVVAIVFEEASYLLTFGPWIARWLKLEYSTALDIDHENDRYTAFTIIVLGEFTYGILTGSPASGGLNFNYMRAVWTLVIAFCFNSMYVYEDGSIDTIHPARRSVWTAFTWLLMHLPLSAGLLIGGHAAAGATSEELNDGQRWLLGGGLAVGFVGMWFLAQLFKDNDMDGRLILSKQVRILPRLLSAITLAILPLASSERLDDTAFLSIAAGISVFTVLWETIGSLDECATLIERWSK